MDIKLYKQALNISEAAFSLQKYNCSAEDLIHFCAIGKLKLAAFFRIEGRKVAAYPYDTTEPYLFLSGLYYIGNNDIKQFDHYKNLECIPVTYIFPIEIEKYDNASNRSEDYENDIPLQYLEFDEYYKIFRADLIVVGDDLRQFVRRLHCNINNNFKDVTSKNIQEITNDDSINNGGAPPRYLTQAIEFAYLKFLKEGNTEILQPHSITEFMKRLSEMTQEDNRNFSDDIAQRIRNVKKTRSGYSITTQEEIVKPDLKRVGRTYDLMAVSKRLHRLRKIYPLPT